MEEVKFGKQDLKIDVRVSWPRNDDIIKISLL